MHIIVPMTEFYLGEECRLIVKQISANAGRKKMLPGESWNRFCRRNQLVERLMKIISSADPSGTSGSSANLTRSTKMKMKKRCDFALNINSIIYRWLLSQKAKDNEEWDPIIPRNTTQNDGFIKYLQSKTVPEYIALSTEQLMQKTIEDYMSVPIRETPAKVKVVCSGSTITVYCADPTVIGKDDRAVSFDMTRERYEQLKRSYTGTDVSFEQCVGELLMRYKVMVTICPGYNGGCPVRLLNYLHDKIGLNYELFASPLNVTLGNYCSAFDDTDKNFGSSGSFFDNIKALSAAGGVFEVNPPFTEEYLSVATHFILEALKENDEVPLTFIYIHPDWSDLYSLQDMFKSKFLTSKILFRRNSHYYESGKQHEPSQRESRLSGCDTVLLILQNEQGKMKVPITEDILNGIRINFTTK